MGSEMCIRDRCKHCLPDCIKTKYDSSISYSELQNCDHTNTGSNMICDLLNNGLNPAPWISMAQNEFQEGNQSVPSYLITNSNETTQKTDENMTKFSDVRYRILDKKHKHNVLFLSELSKNPTYNAFQKDIGLINVFFGDKHIVTYAKRNRMTFSDFMSKIGGSAGLAMGISIISCIEIVYWFTFRLLYNYAHGY